VRLLALAGVVLALACSGAAAKPRPPAEEPCEFGASSIMAWVDEDGVMHVEGPHVTGCVP